MVINGIRLITLLGLTGIGKSTIAKEAVHYMSARRYFTGGIIYISMKGISSFNQGLGKFKRILVNHLLTQADLSDDVFIELLIEHVSGGKSLGTD